MKIGIWIRSWLYKEKSHVHKGKAENVKASCALVSLRPYEFAQGLELEISRKGPQENLEVMEDGNFQT